MSNYVINHLRELESEAIFVIREIAAQFENPCIVIFWRKGFHFTNSLG
jgi:sulfate adenylyltransferase subunit 2